MVSTKDRAKLGQITYQARVHVWSEDDQSQVWSEECRTFKAARLATEAAMYRYGLTSVGVINVGTYEANDIEDEEYGIVHDASWEQDARQQWNLYQRPGGGVSVEHEKW